jgi:hypothetical protein
MESLSRCLIMTRRDMWVQKTEIGEHMKQKNRRRYLILDQKPDITFENGKGSGSIVMIKKPWRGQLAACYAHRDVLWGSK